MRVRAALALLLVCGLAGCADDSPASLEEDLRTTDGATEDDPVGPDAVIAQAEADGARIETIVVSEDQSMLPSACVANPANGCLGGNSRAELLVDREGVDRWVLNLTVTWSASTDLMRTLHARSHIYYECGFGCTAGGDETLEATSSSPLELRGTLDQPVEGRKGLWVIIDAPANLPTGSTANSGQDLHIEGTLVAIDDP